MEKRRRRVVEPSGEKPKIYRHGNTSPSAFDKPSIENVQDEADIELEDSEYENDAPRIEPMRGPQRFGRPKRRAERDDELPTTGDISKPKARGNIVRIKGAKYRGSKEPAQFTTRNGVIVREEPSQYDAHYGSAPIAKRRGYERGNESEGEKPELEASNADELLEAALETSAGILALSANDFHELGIIGGMRQEVKREIAIELTTNQKHEWNIVRDEIHSALAYVREHSEIESAHEESLSFLRRLISDLALIWPDVKRNPIEMIYDRIPKILGTFNLPYEKKSAA